MQRLRRIRRGVLGAGTPAPGGATEDELMADAGRGHPLRRSDTRARLYGRTGLADWRMGVAPPSTGSLSSAAPSVRVATSSGGSSSIEAIRATACVGVQVQAPDEHTMQFPGIRFRRRGRVTRTIERLFGPVLSGMEWLKLGGGETSQGLASSWVKAIYGRGAKVLSVDLVELKEQKEERPAVVDAVLEVLLDGQVVVVSTLVLARCLSYVYFRERTDDLVPLLRSRAVQYGNQLEYPAHLLALVVPGVVATAMKVGELERSAREAVSWWRRDSWVYGFFWLVWENLKISAVTWAACWSFGITAVVDPYFFFGFVLFQWVRIRLNARAGTGSDR